MTPRRAAFKVCHVQYNVANPTARPSASRAISCSPSRSGSAISARDSASSAVVGRARTS